MRPLSPLIRGESFLTLVSEAVWRTRRLWRQKRLPHRLTTVDCELNVRSVGYFSARPRLCSTEHSVIRRIADLIVQGQFPFLSYGTQSLGVPPPWNYDFMSGHSWPYVPASRVKIIRHDGSDVKVPWELSRLQFLPVLGKAYRLEGESKYRSTAKALVSDWIDQNPVPYGVNWTVAMEAALRGISICLLLDLLQPFQNDEQVWLRKVTRSLWEHLLFIEANLEFSH